ncbi:uncharacterized protein LOC130922611 [Corythoichthys intestinalis]|uniref:uncharacterized protein LOC130922611 n=1 Tax=Corythoichthys intestinalis TaxID=161448 RepID=UPI0025A673FB|nr:uncharacterized protein LOC130922611 [Corythoichthys intestinalis]
MTAAEYSQQTHGRLTSSFRSLALKESDLLARPPESRAGADPTSRDGRTPVDGDQNGKAKQKHSGEEEEANSFQGNHIRSQQKVPEKNDNTLLNIQSFEGSRRAGRGQEEGCVWDYCLWIGQENSRVIVVRATRVVDFATSASKGLLESCQSCYQFDNGRSPVLLVLVQSVPPGELIARVGASFLLMTHTLGFRDKEASCRPIFYALYSACFCLNYGKVLFILYWVC